MVEGGRKHGERVAYRQAELIVSRVIERLEAGMVRVESSVIDVKDLLIEKEKTE